MSFLWVHECLLGGRCAGCSIDQAETSKTITINDIAKAEVTRSDTPISPVLIDRPVALFESNTAELIVREERIRKAEIGAICNDSRFACPNPMLSRIWRVREKQLKLKLVAKELLCSYQSFERDSKKDNTTKHQLHHRLEVPSNDRTNTHQIYVCFPPNGPSNTWGLYS